MLRRPTPLSLVAFVIVVSACDDPSPTGPAAETRSESLDVRAPRITNADLVESRVIELSPSPEAAASSLRRVGGDGPAPISDEGSWDLPTPQIFQARTSVGFYDGFAYAQAMNRYNTNVGAIETTVNVDYLAQHLGSHTAETQQYNAFLLNAVEPVKSIWATARVYSDRTCGLSAQASSRHSAWWQFFIGGPAPTWGKAVETSQAAPASQAECATTGSTTTTELQPGGAVCYYYIVYELATGRILSTDLLFCNAAGGELA